VANKELSEKELLGDESSIRQHVSRSSMRRGGFRAGDMLLVLLAILVTALMIFLGAKVIPALRASFSSYSEEICFTVEYPMSLADTIPQAGDGWVLLDSDGAICTVRLVEYSADEGICRVMLLRSNATYQEEYGYRIEDIRIAVGSTLYFRGVSGRYFAATVLSIESDRFHPPVHDSTESEGYGTDGAENGGLNE